MVYYYLADLSDYRDQMSLIASYCTPERIRKAERYKRETDRALSLLAGGGLVAALCEHLEVPKSALRFAIRPDGKPYLQSHSLFFNLSHSGSKVLIALSDNEIGCDLQTAAPPRASLLRRCCTRNEIDYIGSDPMRFATVWSAKEAYLKYTGEGIRRSLTDIACCDPQGKLLPSLFHVPLFSGILYDPPGYAVSITGIGAAEAVKAELQFAHTEDPAL